MFWQIFKRSKHNPVFWLPSCKHFWHAAFFLIHVHVCPTYLYSPVINCILFFFLIQLAILCDENELHIAVLYCTVCDTHLCIECSETTHSTRTLARHKRVPISEKPRENPKCVYHPMHLVEFACLEDECKCSPLMCYICKDYGRHMKHKVWKLPLCIVAIYALYFCSRKSFLMIS